MLYLLTAIALTPGGSSTVHIYTHTHNTQNNTMKQNTQNGTHITLKVKCSRYRSGVAQRVGSSIALLFHDRGTRRE